jgi:hypothetical protein
MKSTPLILACAAWLSACGDTQQPLVCEPHAAGAPAFTDATAEWGLTSVVGNRLVSADLDGDGWPDLLVAAVSSNRREVIGSPPKLVWALMNRPRPDGGGRTFVDATVDSGLWRTRDGATGLLRSAQVHVTADVDNDGDLDVFSGTYVDPSKPDTDPGDRSEILLNDGTGHFTLAPASAVSPAADELWPTTSAAFTDVDRDGRVDLFVGFWYELYGATYNGLQAQLYRGRGDGGFDNATAGSGLETTWDGFEEGTNHRPAYGVTACDLDDDGAPELIVTAYGRQSNLLYRNTGAGGFVEEGSASGGAADANVDYSDNQFFLCACQGGLSDPKCVGAPMPQLVCPSPPGANWNPRTDAKPWRNNGNGFSTWCGDLDGDGKPDLYTASIHHWWAGQSSDSSELVRNISTPGALRFERPGNAATGLVFPHPTRDWNEGALMAVGADLDGDGLEDLVVAASDYPDQYGLVFHQKPDHTFEEVGASWGLHHFCLSGITVADFDRDGDLDVVVGSSTARDCAKVWKTNEVRFYENRGERPRGWLGVRLVGDGVTANRAAIGAKVTVRAKGATQVKEVSGGYGHFGQQNDAGVLMFGVGDCARVEEITVRWPDAAGTTQTFRDVSTGAFIELRQGEKAARPLALR